MGRPSPQTDRVVAVVRALAAEPTTALSLTDLAGRLGIHKATLQPTVAALHRAGWLDRDPVTRGFRLGTGLAVVGEAAALAATPARRARPALVELSARWGATAAAFETRGDEIVLVDQVWDARSSVPPLRPGQRLPLRAPFGALFVAWADDAARLAWATAGAPDPGRAAERHRAALDAIRARGYAVELRTRPEDRLRRRHEITGTDEVALATAVDAIADAHADDESDDLLPEHLEGPGPHAVSAIGAPVFGPEGTVTLVLSLIGFPGHLATTTLERCGHDLARAARRISGAPPAPDVTS